MRNSAVLRRASHTSPGGGNYIRPVFYALQFVMLLAVSLHGADAGGDSEFASAIQRRAYVDFAVEQAGRADAGNFGVSAAYTEYSAGFRWFFLSLGMNRREYDWRADASGSSGDFLPPWDSLTGLTCGLSYFRPLGEGSAVIVNLFGTYGFEGDVSAGTVTYSPQIFGLWEYGPRTTLFAGVGMRRHSVYSSVYPMVGISWEKEGGSGFYGFLGNPAVIGYRFSERIALNLTLGPDNRVYRLSEDNMFSPDGYLRTRDWQAGVSVEKSITEHLTLTAGFNRYLERTAVVYDRDRGHMTSADFSSTGTVFAGMSFSF